ncbi:DNA-directed DNA polymerase delta subunit pol31 [Clonorchis sinensis]|uniref:DNA-directed DNA polymerase delta subunit pol31 n=1 Tax=Clonorchis sinensis TaxID=79923 RepID=A0A8T1LZZ4_CLOSI|nr:DNA-directed DNA polymerase delta subunit pol31 [Clonorchis sinensis]
MTVTLSSNVAETAQFCTVPRFVIPECSLSFHRQYSKIYTARFTAAQPVLSAAATRQWAASEHPSRDQLPIRSLNSLVTDEKCVILGTLYKEMKLKPSILRDLANSEFGQGGVQLQGDTLNTLMSSDDSIFLEDNVQRIRVVMDGLHGVSVTNLATGVVVALLGVEPEHAQGSFHVEDILFLEPQPEKPICSLPANTKRADWTQFRISGPWLALVSGLDFNGAGQTRPGHSMALQLLADWLRSAGDLHPSTDGVGIVRLMILGDSVQLPTSADATTGPTHLTQQARYLTRNADAGSVTAMALLDSWLSTLPLGPGHLRSRTVANGLPVDLLPGPSDAASQLLPQQPIHPSAFPLAVARAGGASCGGLCGRTNPYACCLFGRKILATSGQAVNDLSLYTDLETPCDRMEATLLWGHLAPTCPDTLPGYPLLKNDLLLMETSSADSRLSPDYPDIYVAGCQLGEKPSWRRARLSWKDRSLKPSAHKEPRGALLVAVPRFSQSFSIVLVHLETLDCRVVHFDISAFSDEN